MSLPEIGTLWVGDSLSWLEQLCLQSFLDNGHRVNLFSYGPIEGVPEGVHLEPAGSILSGEDIIRHEKTGSPAYHADVFRLWMLASTDLIWADTDAYCCQPWDVDPAGHFHGWISDKRPQVNNGVLRLPKDSATLREMLAFTKDPYPVPPWLRAAEQTRLRELKSAGDGMHVSLMPWGVWGPDALTWFLKQTGEVSHSRPGHVIYPVPFANARMVFNPDRRTRVDRFMKADTLSIHFWGRRFRNVAATFDGTPPAGSLVADLLIKHRIDPAPTAHKFVRKPPQEPVEVATEKTPTSSGGTAFDDAALQDILSGLGERQISAFADINGAVPKLGAALYERFGCDITIVPLSPRGAVEATDPARFASYAEALKTAGVPPEQLRIARPDDPPQNYELVSSIGGFGVRHKIQHLKPFLTNALDQGDQLVIDIKKGSGTYPFLRQFGTNETLKTKVGSDDTSRAILTCTQTQTVKSGWGNIAETLAGEDGFFHDFGEHSFLHVKRSDTLVVTFDNLDIVMTKRDDRRPWGYAFIEKQGWSMLGVMAGGWTWFRDANVIAEFERLAESGFFDSFKKVVFYGASMGAYGACAFAPAAPGATVIAISPQSTLDKSIVPWESRYKKAWGADYSGRFGDAANTIADAGKVNIFYDPYEPLDTGHAMRMTGENVTHWRCPFLGHRLGSSLNQMGVLGGLVRQCIDGDLTETAFRDALRNRKFFPRYQRELAARTQERQRPGLTKIVCRYVLSKRDDPYFRRLLKSLS